MKNKYLIILAIMALFTVTLAGCNKAASPTPSATAKTNLPTVTAVNPIPPITAVPSTTPSPDANTSSPAVMQSDLLLQVTEPADAATLTAETVYVKGKTLPGATVNVNDEVGTADAQGNFSIPVILEDGPCAIDVITTDGQGNQGEVLLLVNVDLSQSQTPAVSGDSPAAIVSGLSDNIPLTVTSPIDGADINSDTVVVKGQTAPGATVCVNDEVDFADDLGNFSIPIDLETGLNAIVVVATDDNGNQIEVILLVTA